MNFKDKSERAAWDICGMQGVGWEEGVIWTLEQVVNTLWAFGEDEHTKKMKVRQMLADMRGDIQ